MAYRLEQAIAFRESLKIDATAYRLVHGEGDLLPSLVVDRYGDYLVLQTLSQATDRLLPEWARLLNELIAPNGILARNDGRVRGLEGLDTKVEVVSGEVPDARRGARRARALRRRSVHRAEDGPVPRSARESRSGDPLRARTPARLLQLPRRIRAGAGAALHRDDRDRKLRRGVAHIRDNAARNGIDRLEVRTANVFDELREMDRGDERFDTIVLDPPAFAKSRAALPKALAGYKEINLRALRLLTPGGILVTCTCSHHVDEATFGEVVYAAALDAQAQISVVEKRMQGRDHPVLLGVPETYYLKCFILRKL